MAGLFFICFIGTILWYYIESAMAVQNLEPKYKEAHKEYFKSIQRDIKKYAISEDELKSLNIEMSFAKEITGVFWITAIISLIIAAVLSIVIMFILSIVIFKHENQAFFIVWNLVFFGLWISGIFYAKNAVSENIKKDVFAAMDRYRCPHCHAPLGYRQVDSYHSDEQHYMKRVKKSGGSVLDGTHYTYTDDVPTTSYTVHEVFKCYFCKMKDETTYTTEHTTN